MQRPGPRFNLSPAAEFKRPTQTWLKLLPRAPTGSKSNYSQMFMMVKMSGMLPRHLPLTLSIASRHGLGRIIWIPDHLRLACWIHRIGMATWWRSTYECASDVSPFHLRFPRFTLLWHLPWPLACVVVFCLWFGFVSPFLQAPETFWTNFSRDTVLDDRQCFNAPSASQ